MAERYEQIKLLRLGAARRPESTFPYRYRLRRYRWRAFLGIVGPLLVIGFYAFICGRYLLHPAQNGVVTVSTIDARWVYYAWFVTVVFILDWAKTGLANIEATAIMDRRLAPNTAMELMWHADMHWSNVLWWLRGLRQVCRAGVTSTSPKRRLSRPQGFWWLMSATTMLLFVAVPLSGLSFELDRVRARGSRLVDILGPNPTTFNSMGIVNMPHQARANWRSGRPTTPLSDSILYAPHGTPKVSTTYYHDQITSPQTRNNVINVFSGPAVGEMVYGNAWGMQANISCRVVPRDALKLLRIRGWDNYARLLFREPPEEPAFYDINSTEATSQLEGYPSFINETGANFGQALYSLVLATDGRFSGNSSYNYDPFDTSQSWSHETVDGKLHLRPGRVPVALLEAFLWQGANQDGENEVMHSLLQNGSSLITKSSAEYQHERIEVAGFAVQCEVQSAMANVTLDPATRTYSNFTHGTVARRTHTDAEVYSIQLQAFHALASFDRDLGTIVPRRPERDDSTWLAIHYALEIAPLARSNRTFTTVYNELKYPALRPEDLQLALHKLLGETLIVVMDRGGQSPWQGSLRGLDDVVHLKRGVVPFWMILTLLGLWAGLHIGMTLAALWKKRWAATLGGFELFRLGAAYQEEVNALEHPRFERSLSLAHIPGMVGVLPGDLEDAEPSFIGLSEVPAQQDGVFVFDRHQAAR